MFTENRIGAFRKSVGIAVADRAFGGDFAFGKMKTSGDQTIWGYNQTVFDRADLTVKSIVLPQNALVRITGVSMSHNAPQDAIGKGIPIYSTSWGGSWGGYGNENLNQIGPAYPQGVTPSIYLCDKVGNQLIDIDLPLCSLSEPDNNLNILFDTTYNNEIKLFGSGRVSGVYELTGYVQLVTYIGLNYEILSTPHADNVRMDCK